MISGAGLHLHRRLSNNGMHPTPPHGASHVRCVGARVMPGVRLLRVMRTYKFWLPFVCSLVLTPILLFVALISTGAGHGSYSLVKALFPYMMLSAAALGDIYFPFLFLPLFQFPAYGLVLGYANERGRFGRLAAILSAAHCVAAAAALLLSIENYP